MPKKLQRKIEKQLTKLQTLLESMQEALAIEPADPATWDSDSLYNLAEELKEAWTLLEDQKSRQLDEFGDPVILNQGILSLVDDYQSEEEENEDD